MAAPDPVDVLFHPDPLRLEAELAARIEGWRAGADPGHPFDPILVVAPSSRLVHRLRESLARRLGALAGVELTTHQGLGYRLTERDPEGSAPRLLTPALLDRLASLVLSRDGSGPLAAYAARRKGPTHAVGALLRELREAGISPDDLAGDAPEVAQLLGTYEGALATLAARGETDRAGLAARAAGSAAAIPPVLGVVSYGAYELVGMNLSLLRAIPSREGITFLVPGDPEAPASAYAVAFARRHLGAEPKRLEDPAPVRPFVEAARRIHDPESVGPGPLTPERISLVHAQGPEAELTFVARDVLRRVGAGADPREIGVVARTLDPYASLAETVFARHRLPVDSSLSLPLLRHPRAQAFLLLVRMLEEEFPRQIVIELVRSPVFRKPQDRPGGGRWLPHRWDRWSRRQGVTRGLASWRELPERLLGASRGPWSSQEEETEEEFRARCRANADSASELVAWLEETAASWEEAARSPRTGDHARALRSLAASAIHRWEDPGEERDVAQTLEAVLRDLERLDTVAEAVARGTASSPSPAVPSLAFVRESLLDARLPWRDPGGIALLDVMQARGLVFRHLYLIGFNADFFPLHRRQDPFLSDVARRRLREATGHPLAVREEGTDEEHLLLALTVAGAEESLVVTWQRADANGRERPVSLWLRELARGMRDTPALRPLLDEEAEVRPARLPTHPAEAALWHARRTGMVTLEEAGLAASHFTHGEGSGAVRSFLADVDPGRGTRLGAGFDLVRAMEVLETAGGDGLPYDGVLRSPSSPRHPLSATSLAMLGRCPLRFFFRYTLGVHPLTEEAREDRMHPRDLGAHVHEVLESVYRRLDREGRFGPDADARELCGAGREALGAEWERVVAPFAARLRRRYPVLLDHALEVWRGELERFLEMDLTRIAAEGHVLVGVEQQWREDVSLPGPEGPRVAMSLQGYPDRVTRDRDGIWYVSDYKTRGNLQKQVDAKENLMAHRPQLPLYLLLARERGEEPVTAELLGIGPDLDPRVRLVESEEPVRHDPSHLAAVETGFAETLAILGGLPARGLYPFQKGFHCTWCEFRLACRQAHYPSALRVEGDPRFEVYFLTQGKTKTAPLIAQVRTRKEKETARS